MTTNWQQLIGHEWAVESLARDVSDNRLRHAYLITGPAGVGKHTLATAFAQALLCPEENAPCGGCRTCRLVAQGRHPDVSLVTPTVSGRIVKTAKTTIETIRGLIYDFSLRPVEARRRVAICTEFEAATLAAANALLKTLEEPPGDGILILTATSEDTLLPTIVSRCERLALRPLSLDLVKQALLEQWKATSEQADLLASLSGGRLGWAVQMLSSEDALERRADRLTALRRLLEAGRVERFAYAEQLAKDREALLETLDLWQSWWRDVCLVGAGARSPLMNADRETEIRSIANKIGPRRAARAVSTIRTTLEQLDRNANARLALEVLLLELPMIST